MVALQFRAGLWLWQGSLLHGSNQHAEMDVEHTSCMVLGDDLVRMHLGGACGHGLRAPLAVCLRSATEVDGGLVRGAAQHSTALPIYFAVVV